MPGRPSVFVHLLPSLIPPGSLRGGLAVVVDVLRATTAMVHALAAGVKSIIPCVEVEEAREVAAARPKGSVILGGERQGLPIEGFDVGNSPSSYTPEVCAGKTLVMTTTNGTRAIHASLAADRVLIAAFPNLAATNALAAGFDGPVHVVCAGTDGQVSYEDTLLAGAIVEAQAETGRRAGNDSAAIAVGFWFQKSDEMVGQPADHLAVILSGGRGGRRVREIGLARDIDDAAHVDAFDFAAELRREPLRIERL
jgi:2-phosphosulfolactate phosphatase